MTTNKLRPRIELSVLMPYVTELRSRIDERRPLDALVEELGAQKAAMQELRQSMAAVKALIKARDLWLPDLKPRYVGIREIRIDADMPMSSEMGFHALEHDAENGAFRWTGPEPSFYFDLHLDRSAALEFRLRLAVIGSSASNDVSCRTDGAEVLLTRQTDGASVEFSGRLWSRAAIGATRLEFVAQRTFKPATGKRTLGVAFQRLRVAVADAGPSLSV